MYTWAKCSSSTRSESLPTLNLPSSLHQHYTTQCNRHIRLRIQPILSVSYMSRLLGSDTRSMKIPITLTAFSCLVSGRLYICFSYINWGACLDWNILECAECFHLAAIVGVTHKWEIGDRGQKKGDGRWGPKIMGDGRSEWKWEMGDGLFMHYLFLYKCIYNHFITYTVFVSSLFWTAFNHKFHQLTHMPV